jgi:hypothetical protein
MIARISSPHQDCPDLQALVRLHGGYQHITAEGWAEWARAVAGWRQDCRDQLCRELEVSKRRTGATRRMRGEKRWDRL